jgi:hypothetical protein
VTYRPIKGQTDGSKDRCFQGQTPRLSVIFSMQKPRACTATFIPTGRSVSPAALSGHLQPPPAPPAARRGSPAPGSGKTPGKTSAQYHTQIRSNLQPGACTSAATCSAQGQARLTNCRFKSTMFPLFPAPARTQSDSLCSMNTRKARTRLSVCLSAGQSHLSPSDEPQQRRLALAVGPHQPVAPVCRDGALCILEQHLALGADRQVCDLWQADRQTWTCVPCCSRVLWQADRQTWTCVPCCSHVLWQADRQTWTCVPCSSRVQGRSGGHTFISQSSRLCVTWGKLMPERNCCGHDKLWRE